MNKDLQYRTRPAAMIGPLAALAIFLAFLALALRANVALPMGDLYRDLGLWLDAAHRIDAGQIPGMDFFAPSGPLGYYLFAEASQWFEDAHPLWLAQWSTTIITAPIMALLVIDIAPRSRATAWAMLLPYMLFSALPFNLVEMSIVPGVDAFGLQDRQAAILFYLLAAGLILVRNPFLLALAAAAAITALFLFSITGFLAGGLLFAYAILAGRIRWSVLFAILVIFYGTLGGLEYATGMVSAHIESFALSAQGTAGGLPARMGTAFLLQFGLAGLALAVTLLWFDRERMQPAYSENVTYLGRRRAINAIFNAPAGWFIAVMIASLLLESRLAGGQGFIALWPAIWLILRRLGDFQGGRRAAIATLCAAVALPPVVNMLHRTALAAATMTDGEELQHEHLGQYGNVSTSAGLAAHADALQQHYVRHRRAYMALAEAGATPSFLQDREPGQQLVWLRELDRLAGAIKAWEAENGRRLESLHVADATDPLPALLGRNGPRLVQLSADTAGDPRRERPGRMEALRQLDAIILPRCPETRDRLTARTRLMPALEGRQAIEITPCYTMMLTRETQ